MSRFFLALIAKRRLGIAVEILSVILLFATIVAPFVYFIAVQGMTPEEMRQTAKGWYYGSLLAAVPLFVFTIGISHYRRLAKAAQDQRERVMVK